MSARRTTFVADLRHIKAGKLFQRERSLPVALGLYVAVADVANARRLARYFKSGSGKAFAKKRFLTKTE
jgi:putative endonuclease